MPFNNRSELRTLQALHERLTPHGYLISQKVRVLDCVLAAAERTESQADPFTGFASTFGYLLQSVRKAAGPFCQSHPWLLHGDWKYAMLAHFDFVVHSPLDDVRPSEPLFAVEFDGTRAHATPDARRRDLAKNRLCMASGLPLLRISDSYLCLREREPVLDWLAEMWDAYRKEIPSLARQSQSMRSPMSRYELLIAQDDWRGGDCFYADPDRTFQINHPFPPALTSAERLATTYDFHEGAVLACYGAVTEDVRRVTPRLGDSNPLWRVAEFDPPRLLVEGLLQRWESTVILSSADRQQEVRACAELQAGYPLSETLVPGDLLDFLARDEFPFLPAGPWLTAPYLLGPALCIHNTLLAIERFLSRTLRHR